MILSNVPYASILATVLRVCVFQRYGFSRLEQFHPMAKYCIALELRSSKFEFILLSQLRVGAVALDCISALPNPDVSFELAMFRNLLTQVSSSLTGL
jgi:hypothetical protein